MVNKLLLSILLLLIFLTPKTTFAVTNSYVNVINPVRGNDFWEEKFSQLDTSKGEMLVLKKYQVPATWLVRPDALQNGEIVSFLKSAPSNHEIGLFLEITPTWTNQAHVTYKKSNNWHSAGSVFLTGYDLDERKKLIDSSFENFKSKFGVYPKSVGAWFIDAYSLSYMQDKYKISGALIVSDQYSTDNYQIWGQYFSTPYIPDKNNTLTPAQSEGSKLPLVITQWASRDPVNGYGKGVEESTFSVQPNDYIDYHDLNIKYFDKLIDIYTQQKYNQLNELVVGLENSYSWQKYGGEYENQIKSLKDKSSKGQFALITQSNFSNWYLDHFKISPTQIIVADDPLGSDKKTVWFMDPYYRAGWFYNFEGSVFRDIRQYIEGQPEICLNKSCNTLNFATAATRVLDDVSFSQKWLLDEGKISDLVFSKGSDRFSLSYINQAGTKRLVEFMPRDISYNGRISSIDGLILEAQQKSLATSQKLKASIDTSLKSSMLSLLIDFGKFLIFLLVFILIPSLVVFRFISSKNTILENLFLSLAFGLSGFTLVSYILGFLKLLPLLWFIGLIFLALFIYKKEYQKLLSLIEKLRNYLSNIKTLAIFGVILLGTIFQVIPAVKNGLLFGYGMGFWGPNSHDGLWHIALINQIKNGLIPANPVFAGVSLKNYNYLFDLLVSSTNYLTHVSTLDLLFRFYPILFSLLLGVGTLILTRLIIGERINQRASFIASLFSLFFVYFVGSFGWIVSLIKDRTLNGESAFWANQSISYNLNPPFAISLILVIALVILITKTRIYKSRGLIIVTAIILGSLIGFKAYGAILLFLSLGLLGLYDLAVKKNLSLIFVLAIGALVSIGVYLPNFTYTDTFIYSPFWLIHTMIDDVDRVGWLRLSAARDAYFERGEWHKYLLVELIGFLMFVVGNLGLRLFGLFALFKLNLFREFSTRLIGLISLFGLLIPLLFIQQGTAWNTIQFLYYFLYFTAIFSGIMIGMFIKKLPLVLGVIVALLVIILTPINSWATAKGYLYPLPHTFISKDELSALAVLKNQPEGVILTPTFEKDDRAKVAEPFPIYVYETTAYVSALADKKVYLEDEIQAELLGLDYKPRRVKIKDFFVNKEKQSSFASENSIKYIYIPKFYSSRLEEGKLFEKLYENDGAIVYKVK